MGSAWDAPEGERAFRHIVASRTEWETRAFLNYAFKYLAVVEESLQSPTTPFVGLE